MFLTMRDCFHSNHKKLILALLGPFVWIGFVHGIKLLTAGGF